MKRALILSALYLNACAITPKECRELWVNVPDGAPRTGRVVSTVHSYPAQIARKCSGNGAGCARAAGIDPHTVPSSQGTYEIWYAHVSVLPHEFCHAEFEVFEHVSVNRN